MKREGSAERLVDQSAGDLCSKLDETRQEIEAFALMKSRKGWTYMVTMGVVHNTIVDTI